MPASIYERRLELYRVEHDKVTVYVPAARDGDPRGPHTCPYQGTGVVTSNR